MAGGVKLTLSVMTADVGGFVGHVSSHPDVLDTAKERLFNAKDKSIIEDFHVLRCGDDLELIITHRNGPSNRAIHELAWNIFGACKEAAGELKLHATERGLLNEPFTGSIKCMGPGVAEMEFIERPSEPVLIFMANKTGVGAWNLPLYKIFADPFNTAGLIIDPLMLEGFSFKVMDLKENKEIILSTPKETYYLLALIGSTCRYIVTDIYRNSDVESVATLSSQKYTLIGGRVAGRCEPAMIVRCQAGFPAIGEAMEAFAFPYLVEGWMRGAHVGPLMPVPFYEANPTRFDGPPRVIAAGFQIADGRLIGPHDMFDDPSFDCARSQANRTVDYIRRNGPFKPHRLPELEMESTSMPVVLEKLSDRFKKIG